MKRCKFWFFLCLLFLLLSLHGVPSALAHTIHLFETYPRLSALEAEKLSPQKGGILLTADGITLPYDEASNTYFIPQDRSYETFDGEIRLAEREGFSYFILEQIHFSKQLALDTSAGLTIYGVGDSKCISTNVVFTPLPVICIDTENREMPGDADENGTIQIYTAHNGHIYQETAKIEINLRGNTSKWLPKKSYRVKIVDEYGNNRKLSLCGLRSDDDWILNPMYSDTSKIREALAYELWAQINSSGDAAQSSRLQYAEVFFHGEYWGLYGIQERIDRKQVNGNKNASILYKIFANDRPIGDELLSCMDTERCGGFEIKFYGEYVTNLWKPAAGYMAFLDGSASIETAGLSIANIIDYGLWAMLVQAHDCRFKNQFLHCDYTDKGYTLYKIPWDLNNTFGDVWLLDSAEENYTGYRLGTLVMDSAFDRLLQSKQPEIYQTVIKRYRELRQNGIDVQTIISRARSIHQPVYAAIARDGKRWPQCGMGDGNANNIRDIETSLHDTIYRMDLWIDSLEKAF